MTIGVDTDGLSPQLCQKLHMDKSTPYVNNLRAPVMFLTLRRDGNRKEEKGKRNCPCGQWEQGWPFTDKVRGCCSAGAGDVTQRKKSDRMYQMIKRRFCKNFSLNRLHAKNKRPQERRVLLVSNRIGLCTTGGLIPTAEGHYEKVAQPPRKGYPILLLQLEVLMQLLLVLQPGSAEMVTAQQTTPDAGNH